jgi:integrase
MAKKLPPGFSRRDTGSLVYRFYVDGKRYAVYGLTVNECKEKELEKRKAIASGTVKARKADKRTDPDVSDYFEIWMKRISGKIAGSTSVTYSKHIRRMLWRKIDGAGCIFGDIKLKNLCYQDIEDLKRALLNDGLSTRTVNDTISLLKKALDDAVNKDRLITFNPAKGVDREKRTEPPARDTKHRNLSDKEVDLFLETASELNSWYYNMYILLLFTGLRIGEASAITPRDITGDLISICKTVTKEAAGYIIKNQTKTAAGTRLVPMVPEAREAIESQMGINRAVNNTNVISLDAPIFVMPHGGIIRGDRVNEDIKRICEKAGIEYFSCHAFRATHISRCAKSGMKPQNNMEIHGHTKFQMTLLYTHADEEQKKTEMLAVNYHGHQNGHQRAINRAE